MSKTDWINERNRCVQCNHFRQFSSGSLMGLCVKTSKQVSRNQIPECYGCNFYSDRGEKK